MALIVTKPAVFLKSAFRSKTTLFPYIYAHYLLTKFQKVTCPFNIFVHQVWRTTEGAGQVLLGLLGGQEPVDRRQAQTQEDKEGWHHNTCSCKEY